MKDVKETLAKHEEINWRNYPMSISVHWLIQPQQVMAHL